MMASMSDGDHEDWKWRVERMLAAVSQVSHTDRRRRFVIVEGASGRLRVEHISSGIALSLPGHPASKYAEHP